ncbi:hypothetical protein ALC60_13980 [Trachymyrmex zeteki]|uniref:Uncharacterized protein n=1 Tax=Mycetomoellerius zeteki TaxID=64791 RepID=A0A151WGS4_9HYME|nr:hypothetical protein ALC60_13980 [Trachymyrmex zeteki]
MISKLNADQRRVFDRVINIYCQVNINMRQQGDGSYRKLLSRIRVGLLTPSDYDILEKRKISFKGESFETRLSELCDFINNLSDTVCLLSTCHMCNELNAAMLSRITLKEILLIAENTIDCRINVKFPLISIKVIVIIKCKTLKQANSTVSNNEDEKKTSWFTIPFFPHLYGKFKNIVMPELHRRPIYVRDIQTGRKLKTRISEHCNYIYRKTGNPSVITDHRLNFEHEFDWKNTKILDNERYYKKRLVSEMLHIKSQTNSLNAKSDTEFLHHVHTNIIEKIMT